MGSSADLRMIPEVTLTITDDVGDTRQLVVHSKRLTIGRTPENDLVIENSSLSRRHAVIETFDGVVQISDCGSQNGTEVNGVPVAAGTVLFDGDIIRLGGVCDIDVSISDSTGTSPSREHYTKDPLVHQVRAGAGLLAEPRSASHSGSQPSWLNQPGAHLTAAIAGIVVILGAGGVLLFLISQSQKQQRITNRPPVTHNDTHPESSPSSTTDSNNNASPGPGLDKGNGGRDISSSGQQIENAAAAVVRRISSDDKTYTFNEKTLQDITRKVNQFKTSGSLVGNLTAIQRSGSSLGALARKDGIEPGLLIYLLLAEAEARQSVDPKAIAPSVASDLLALRATFGTNDADGSLLVIAAYKLGRGERRSHPLLVTIRRLVKHPLTQRNVWYLNDHGGLDPQVYEFILSFLALGVIAQDPGQFGVNATPLVF